MSSPRPGSTNNQHSHSDWTSYRGPLNYIQHLVANNGTEVEVEVVESEIGYGDSDYIIARCETADKVDTLRTVLDAQEGAFLRSGNGDTVAMRRTSDDASDGSSYPRLVKFAVVPVPDPPESGGLLLGMDLSS